MIGLTISPNVLPLPAIDTGAVRRFLDGKVSSIKVTMTRAVLTCGCMITKFHKNVETLSKTPLLINQMSHYNTSRPKNGRNTSGI
ncbi:hypothetical protein NOS3756_04000 [Nostoc sp. NIES-3756]|jgi:hypothetical protein|nr:hypothetical protein NOS3756_04000 [Nostoc sp. NIES-3756]